MKRFMFALALVGMTCALIGCSHSKDEAPAAKPEKTAEPESRVKHGTNGELVITVDAATQKIMGLETTSLVATQMNAQVKAFGRVLDPAPLAELVVELSKTELEFDNSHAELERMKVLKQQNNASEKAFQTAENMYSQNQVAAAAVLGRIKNAWGQKLMEMTGPIVVPVGTTRKWDAVLEQIMDGQTGLVRIDLSPGESMEQQPGNARLVPLDGGAAPVDARFFDNARTVDPQTQGRGLLFLVESAKLAPGAAVTAFMNTAGVPADGAIVPRSAVVRFNGATWVYLQKSDDSFERKEVALTVPVTNGWFAKGMSSDARVVTVGAQQLLSEESKGQGSEE